MLAAASFAANGYWVEAELITVADCDFLVTSLSEVVSDKKVGGRRNLMQRPTIREFANDSRLLDLVERLTGEEMVPYKATLFEKTEQANWLVAFHQDTALPVEEVPSSAGWGSASVKKGINFAHAPTGILKNIVALRIHLDDSTYMNGPLRVVPGSHRKRWMTDEEFGIAQKIAEPVECLTHRGGVIAMRPLILHASSKSISNEPRRVLHIEYAASLQLGKGIRLALA